MIRFSLKTAQEQARYIGRLLESDKDEVKRCQNIVLRPYREQARTLMDALAEKDVERTAVYRKYERCEIEQEQLENFESRYQAEIEELEAEFKNIMMKVSAIEKAFSYANPWLIKFQDLTLPEVLELAHIRKYVERVWIEDFKRVEVVFERGRMDKILPGGMAENQKGKLKWLERAEKHNAAECYTGDSYFLRSQSSAYSSVCTIIVREQRT